MSAARALRAEYHGRTVTFSKKAFVSLVNLCRDSCTYCTYQREPGEAGASMMDKRAVGVLLDMAARFRCTEALLVTGERPEERYEEARRWLHAEGFASTAEYLVHCSEMALERGLFPHTNAGNLSRSEMADLQKTNASMGLMLENASPRLSERGMPHHLAPSKEPGKRMRVLENAGELGIPVTTGLLVGMGETPGELVDSLFAIQGLSGRHGNIQEVIIQNFRPKPDTMMGSSPPAGRSYLMAAAALARVLMPRMNIQVPPNLSPGSYSGLLDAGINDWGGISPLTPDHVNPEHEWPAINEVEDETRAAGLRLACRFPVYPEFAGMVHPRVREMMLQVSGPDGLVREGRWR
ncbi:thiamine biosynthesis enzyme [Cenarchaeum symbiosum A]|uniref:7,8-didemethyl-8-hydroxy-5-deazariboflavin synthase n=1 Tax=Cenarchaeum symbiosum (strain A) TaxID=414004 RepID=A0RWZ5_CENSY|nr:thiamine biosynthesis enzyme [Cenarchaeum symbiosum A]